MRRTILSSSKRSELSGCPRDIFSLICNIR